MHRIVRTPLALLSSIRMHAARSVAPRHSLRWASSGRSPEFDAAVVALKQLTSEPDNETKLKLYALFKQATVGPNDTAKPGMFDMVGKFKWQAWKDLGSMSQAAAEAQYVALCASLGAAIGGAAKAPSSAAGSSPAATASSSSAGYTTLEVSQDGGVQTITLARPEKRNAISIAMYKEVIRALAEARENAGVRVVVLTGKGPYYCAGNDLTNFTQIGDGGVQAFAESARQLMEEYVASFIRFPKLLFVGVNGPAVGIPVTTLPLADYVLASHTATFSAPLVGLGQTPEGCSSVTFPRLMGHARAADILVLGKRLTASQAEACGLVNEVVEEGAFRAALAARAQAAAGLPPVATLRAKKLLRAGVLAELESANREEGAVIKECWLGPEVQAAVMKFLSKSGGSEGGASGSGSKSGGNASPAARL